MADPIKHVVALMLENHSFDQMLGSLKQIYPSLEGVDPARPFINKDKAGNPYQQMPTTERQMPLDPHHEVEHVAVQIQNGNTGFIEDFGACYANSTPQDCQNIMGYYPLGFLPALHVLGREFTVCDHWFSSLPGPTWPNRFFALAGTANGRVGMPGDGTHGADLAGYFQQNQVTLFDRLSEKGINWKCYFHDIPQSWVLCHQRRPENAARYYYINRFYQDARGLADDFPQFCFIEPRFLGFDENDDHPPHDIMKAEKLVADVYNSLRANPDLWQSTLLVIYYDEHGGFFDHVVPPKAVPPDANTQEYSFDQLGLRVPALLVSPWVKRGVESTQFDHTSLLKYLIEKWDLGPLGRRTAAAASIAVAIESAQPMHENTIARITLSVEQLVPPDPVKEEQSAESDSPHQLALQAMVRYFDIKRLFLTGVEVDLPVGLAFVARIIERIKYFFSRHADHSSVIVSPSQPDHISGKQGRQAKAHKDFTTVFRKQKMRSLSVLAQKVRCDDQTQREHAMRALSSLTGRKFHHEADLNKNIDRADEWLRRHKH